MNDHCYCTKDAWCHFHAPNPSGGWVGLGWGGVDDFQAEAPKLVLAQTSSSDGGQMTDRFSLPDTVYTPAAVANIVRAEVERALVNATLRPQGETGGQPIAWGWITNHDAAYLAARFGGAFTTIPAGPFGISVVEQEGEPERTHAANGLLRAALDRYQSQMRNGVPVPYTESERAFLRLFVRDYLAQVDLPAGLVRGADTVAAARALLAEGEE